MVCVTAQATMPGVRPALLFLLLVVILAATACREEGNITVSGLHFNGVDQVNKASLAYVLQTKKGSILPWGRKRYFDRRAFEADLKRIQAFYADRGFPDARITSFDIKLNEAQDKVDVTVNISEGEPIVVTDIDLRGFEPPLTAGELRALKESLPLLPDGPLDRQLALASRERGVNVLRDRGYPYAEVTMTEEAEGPRRTRLALSAVPGTLAHFGPVEVVGAASVSENVVVRQLTFKPGELFTRREMRESQRKLYGLELFQFINVVSQEDTQNQAPEVPVRVTVAEGKHQKVTFGVGYGTEEQARARVRWDHVNFLGGARHAGAEAKWSSLDRGLRIDYREPFFLASHFSLNVDGQTWQAAEPAYSLNSVGGRVTLRHQANTQNFWTVSLINEYQHSTISNAALEDLSLRDELIALGLDPTDGELRGTLAAVAFNISRNTTTSLLDARSGYVLTGHVEQASKWMVGDFDYWSTLVEGRHYLPIGRRLVFANKLRVGTIDAPAQSSVPFYKRYFLGGSSSIRGWGRFEVGPVSGFGLPIGGHSMLEGSSEARLPLFGKFGAVAFLDYGNVFSASRDIDLGDLRYAVGPGVRYMTPVGPARMDFGYQLNPIPNLKVNGVPEPRRWRIHFSIGQSF